MYHVFGTSTDRQLVANVRGSVANLLFKTDGEVYDVEAFQLEEETGACFAEHNGEKYFIVAPTEEPKPKKIKPATMEIGASDDRRLCFMKFKDDGESTDYAVSTPDQKIALVDHSKYVQCGIGNAELGSSFYVHAMEESMQVHNMPTDHLQTLAEKVFTQSRRDKQAWMDAVGDYVGLGQASRGVFTSDTFVSKVNKSAILFVPSDQDNADTAAMLLLRANGDADQDKKYAETMGIDHVFVGNAGDEASGGVIMGRIGTKAVGVCCLGLARADPQAILNALVHAAPKNLLLDFASLNLSASDIAEICSSKTVRDKTVCVVVPRTTDQQIMDDLSEISNAEVVRNTASKSIASRINSGMTCTIVHGCPDNRVITDQPFESCRDTYAALTSPLFATSLLQPDNWEKYSVSRIQDSVEKK
jgi:hypothetical protein